MKKILIIFLLIIVVIVSVSYLIIIQTPSFPGRLVLDLNNNTWEKISGVTLTYEGSPSVIQLPDLKSQERLVILAPSSVFEKPIKTQVYLNYNGQRYTVLDEYYTLTGAKFNTDIIQVAKIRFKANDIHVLGNRRLGRISYLNLKPYFRVIDMDL